MVVNIILIGCWYGSNQHKRSGSALYLHRLLFHTSIADTILPYVGLRKYIFIISYPSSVIFWLFPMVILMVITHGFPQNEVLNATERFVTETINQKHARIYQYPLSIYLILFRILSIIVIVFVILILAELPQNMLIFGNPSFFPFTILFFTPTSASWY